MSPIDQERVGDLFGTLRQALGLLRDLRGMDENTFASDDHKQSSAKYNLIIAIEVAIDVANHLISRRAFRAPQDYADTFQVLGENGVLEKDFVEELKKMARFRNRLVHMYWKVDTPELWRIVQERLDDFERFIKGIGAYMATVARQDKP